MALCAATQEAIHLRFLMQDMDPKYRQSNSAVLIFEDNTACIAMSANPVHHERTKHIDNKYHFIRERIYMRDIQVQFVGTNVMIADLLTKAVMPQVSLTLLPALMGMTNIFDHVAEYYPKL
jgi:sensor c-di-GMP phosphodiesterase-like protein